MRSIITVLLVISGFALSISPLGLFAESEGIRGADFYVSTDGDDSWSGILKVPNKEASDGPFATLKRARDAVRELKIQSPKKDILVYIRKGTYLLAETLVFSLEDSAQGDATITYAAYPGEKPVFSSAQEIQGWKKLTENLPGLPHEAEGKVWVADVSDMDRFTTMYDDAGRLPRARSEAFTPLTGGKKNILHFPKGKLKNWSNIEDVEIVVRPHHAWIVNVLPLVSVDERKQLAQTAIEATYEINPLHFMKNEKSVWVENIIDELDEPGEWALNTKEGRVYLWPRGKSPVVVPQLQELIRIEGAVDKEGPVDQPVRNICFRGLSFMHGTRYTLTADDKGLQHDWDMHDKDNALLRLRGTENCIIEQCHFLNSGSGAIRIDLHGQENKIVDNHIEHMGGAGILLCGYGPGTKDVNKDNLVYNNHVHHVGEVYSHSPGIMLWQSGENRVANNLVHHTPYIGIIISGCMDHFFEKSDQRELVRTIRWHEVKTTSKNKAGKNLDPYMHTRNNIIEYNEIHHVMEKLADGNGIYIRGSGPGNVIRRNYLHHLLGETKMQSAIRTDGGQRDTLIAENIIYKCMSQGIILKLNNRCENNIIADIIAPPRGNYLSIREGPMTGASNQRNIFYASSDKFIFIDEVKARNKNKTEDRRGRKLARIKDADSDYNIYYCAENPELSRNVLNELKKQGIDANSRSTDPLFVDAANGDFRFKPDSPALKLGFLPINVSEIGLRKEKFSDGKYIQARTIKGRP